jgi:hypothetical protein
MCIQWEIGRELGVPKQGKIPAQLVVSTVNEPDMATILDELGQRG